MSPGQIDPLWYSIKTEEIENIYELVRDLNTGPRAPEARIIPLDQQAFSSKAYLKLFIISSFDQLN